MGVTGAGKTTVGELLAQQLGWEFADADNFHSPTNIEKMSRGIALTDEDRAPWLQAIHVAMAQRTAAGRDVVLACSALKLAYRRTLREGLEMRIIYLRGSQEYIVSRLTHRSGHYATGSLVASQFADLEEPGAAEGVLVVGIERSTEEIVAEIRKGLGL
jgi:gluconokinase